MLLLRLVINGNNIFPKFESDLFVHLQTGYWQGNGEES